MFLDALQMLGVLVVVILAVILLGLGVIVLKALWETFKHGGKRQ